MCDFCVIEIFSIFCVLDINQNVLGDGHFGLILK